MLRLWGIRHLRYWWHCYHLARWVERCQRHGVGYFAQQAALIEGLREEVADQRRLIERLRFELEEFKGRFERGSETP